MNEVIIQNNYNLYPEVIVYDDHNPTLRSPCAEFDLPFYQTKETLMDVDIYRNFLKNVESRFRASKEYKAYKSYLIEYLGINRCQIMGNITTEDATIELHHNVLGLFDICLLISSHIVNTVGVICTFDLLEILIKEHWANRVGVTFLSKTAHQMYTNDPDGFIPPDQTFGKWWELLYDYRYGITLNIANKVINYLKKYENGMPTNIRIPHQEELLNFAWANEYGESFDKLGFLPNYKEFEDSV
jgi:hypothetical protein